MTRMKRTRKAAPRWLGVIATACILGCTAVAVARPPVAHAAPASSQMSLEQAVREVQHQTRGRILAADTISRGRANVYRIKVLTPQGKIRVVQLRSDSQSRSGAESSGAERGEH